MKRFAGEGNRYDGGSRLPQHGRLTWRGQLMPPKPALETFGKPRQRPAQAEVDRGNQSIDGERAEGRIVHNL
jgi:hypothetical protein